MSCTKCGVVDETRLYAVIDAERRLCNPCWRAAGCPWPRRPLPAAEVEAAQLEIRRRMDARGGAHRHLVHKGLT